MKTIEVKITESTADVNPEKPDNIVTFEDSMHFDDFGLALAYAQNYMMKFTQKYDEDFVETKPEGEEFIKRFSCWSSRVTILKSEIKL